MNSADLFSGAGGLSLGLHQAGIKTKYLVDIDPYCCEVLRFNASSIKPIFDQAQIIQSDVDNIDSQKLFKNIDLISGGPPCQPFSLAGIHKAESDSRESFPTAINIIRKLKPKYFLFENVKELTRSKFLNYFEYICLQLKHPEVEKNTDELWKDHFHSRC